MSDSDFNHLHPEARLIAVLADEERIERIGQPRWVEYPAASKVSNRIDDLLTQPRSDRMENLLVTARSGAGKTSLINRAERIVYVGPDAARSTTHRPLVKVLMPPNPTEKELLWSIGKALHVPTVELSHLEGSRMRDAVFEMLHNLGARMLVIDEINSVLVGTPREQRRYLQFLRYLSNELGVALVCVGTPEAQHALHADEQLRSRFSHMELPPWQATGGDLQDFIIRFVQSMPLRRASPVRSIQICSLVVDRSGGITAPICKAFRRAAVNAVRSGKEMIDLAGLQDESVWEGFTVLEPPYRSRPMARDPARGAPA